MRLLLPARKRGEEEEKAGLLHLWKVKSAVEMHVWVL